MGFSSVVSFFGFEGHARHSVEVAFALRAGPQKYTRKKQREQAQRNRPVVLDPAEVSQDILDHSRLVIDDY
jgi:hypothetical protein